METLDNETLLAIIKERVNAKTLDVEKVRELVFVQGSQLLTKEEKPRWFSFTKLLYIIGGVIVSLGLIFFVGQIWNEIGSISRILITFGLGMLLAWYGTHFMRTQPNTHLGDLLHAIAGLFIPGGALVILNELSTGIDSVLPVIIVFFGIFFLYLLLLRIIPASILVFYAIANGTIAITLLFIELFDRVDDQIYRLYAMVIGIVYVYLAYAFKKEWNNYLITLLEIIGSAAFYISAFLSIFDGDTLRHSGQSLFWELLFPLFAIGGMIGAIKVRSRNLLLVTTISLISYIVYLTSEYFTDSIGWPLALVILGFLVIGIGYFSINLSKRYI